jgi:hypothetical protein
LRHVKPDALLLPRARSLPMGIQIGDRFTDAEGEWEVLSHPATLHGAKSLRARVRRKEPPAAERDVTWPAHVRVEVRRVLHREHPRHEVPPVPSALGQYADPDPLHHVHRVDETAGRLVQPILRQALQMQRQIAREGRWNLTPAFLAAPQALLKVPVSFRPCKA